MCSASRKSSYTSNHMNPQKATLVGGWKAANKRYVVLALALFNLDLVSSFVVFETTPSSFSKISYQSTWCTPQYTHFWVLKNITGTMYSYYLLQISNMSFTLFASRLQSKCFHQYLYDLLLEY